MRYTESANSLTENRTEVTGAGGRGERYERHCPTAAGVLLGVMKSMELDSSDACTTHLVPLGNCTLHNSSNGNFHIRCVFPPKENSK